MVFFSFAISLSSAETDVIDQSLGSHGAFFRALVPTLRPALLSRAPVQSRQAVWRFRL